MLVPYMQADGFRKVKMEKVEEMKRPMEQGSQVARKEKPSSSKTAEVNQQLTITINCSFYLLHELLLTC